MRQQSPHWILHMFGQFDLCMVRAVQKTLSTSNIGALVRPPQDHYVFRKLNFFQPSHFGWFYTTWFINILSRPTRSSSVSSGNETKIKTFISSHTHRRERKYTWKISPRRFSEIRAVSSIFRGIWGWKNVKESTRSQGFETVNIATTAWIKGGYTTRCTHLAIFNKFCGSGWKFPQTQSQSPYSSFLYKIFSS